MLRCEILLKKMFNVFAEIPVGALRTRKNNVFNMLRLKKFQRQSFHPFIKSYLYHLAFYGKKTIFGHG